MEQGKFAKYDGYEVDGRNVRNVTDAFRLFPDVGLRPLIRRGIGRATDGGGFVVDPSGWVPLPLWLEAFDEIVQRVGPSKMIEIGSRIPENSPFPPNIDSLSVAIASLDAAYHLNHRKEGQVMFDVATGEMLEGIGHYAATLQPDGRSASLVCDAPYPCELDRGILYGLGRRFGHLFSAGHAPDTGCRSRGDAACSYIMSW